MVKDIEHFKNVYWAYVFLLLKAMSNSLVHFPIDSFTS